MLYNSDGQIDYTPVQQMRDDLTATMRSVKDTIAMSFQQLNMTLSSMNGTLRNMASYTPNVGVPQISNMLPSQNTPYLGAMSNPMAGYLASAGGFDLTGVSSQRPFNISSMEFYRQRENELMHRTGVLGAGLATDVVSGTAAGIGFGAISTLAKAKKWGTLASFGAPILGSMAAGLIVSPWTSAVETESQNFARDAASMQRLGSRFNGTGLSYSSARDMSGWLNTSALRESRSQRWDSTLLGSEGYRDLTMTGLASGLFSGNNTNDLKKQIESAAQLVRFLSGVMNSSDVKESINALMQMKQMGVNPLMATGVIQGLGRSAFGYGASSGMSAGQMMNMGLGIGAHVAGATGLPGVLGMRYGMAGMPMALSMERMGFLNATDMSKLGGAQGAATQYALGMANAAQHPAFGGMLAAAFMGPNGTLSQNRMVGGGYFGMMGAAMTNVMSPGRMAMYLTGKDNILGQISQTNDYSNPINDMMRSAMSPILQASGAKGRNERTSMIAVMLQQMGVAPTLEAGKMMASDILYPEHSRRELALRDAQVSAGRAAERRGQYSFGAGVGRFRRGVNTAIESFYNDVVLSPAHALTRGASDLFGDTDLARRTDADLVRLQAYNPEALTRESSSSLTGGPSRVSTGTLEDYYDTNYNRTTRGGWYMPGWTSNATKVMGDSLDAFQRYTTYGDYYNQKTGNINVLGRAKSLGFVLDPTEYKNSSQYGKIGGGAEFVANKLNRDKLLSDLAGGMSTQTATEQLRKALGTNNLSKSAAAIEHQLLQSGKLNENRQALAAYSRGRSGPGISAATLLANNPEALAVAKAIEERYTDPTQFESIMKMSAPGSSEMELAEAMRITGLGSKDLSSISSDLLKTPASKADYDALEALIMDINSPRRGRRGISGTRESRLSMLADIQNPVLQKYAEQILKSGDTSQFSGMGKGAISASIEQAMSSYASNAANAQFDFTAENVWGIRDADQRKALRASMVGMNSGNIAKQLSGMDLSMSPALQDLRDTASDIARVTNKYRGRTLGSLRQNERIEVEDAFKTRIDFTNNASRSIEEEGKRVTGVATVMAGVTATEEIHKRDTKLESTVIKVGSQSAIAVVMFQPEAKEVQQLTANGRAMTNTYIDTTTGLAVDPKGRPVKPTDTGSNTTKTPNNPTDQFRYDN